MRVAVVLVVVSVVAATVFVVAVLRDPSRGAVRAAPREEEGTSIRTRLRTVAESVGHLAVVAGVPPTAWFAVQRFRRDHVVTFDAVLIGTAIVALAVVSVLLARARRQHRVVRSLRARRFVFGVSVVAVVGTVGATSVDEKTCDAGKPQAEPPIMDLAVPSDPGAGAVHAANPAVVRLPNETPPAFFPDRQPTPSGDEGVGELAVAGCLTKRGN